MTISELKLLAVKTFTSHRLQTPFLDADCLLQFLLKKDKTYILLHKNESLTDAQCDEFLSLVKKREQGLPIAYITSTKEFYGRNFFVTPKVLIPKPDTEILVEQALNEISKIKKSIIKVCDVCTGSGCVGLSIFEEAKLLGKKIELTLTDISSEALDIAKQNKKNICKSDSLINFVNGDLLCGLSNFDVIVSNPPYVPHEDVSKLLLDGRSEPPLALDGDTDTAISEEIKTCDGLQIIKRLIPMAKNALVDDGIFLMESGEYQTKSVRSLLLENGFKDVKTWNDLSNQERVTTGKR